MSNDWLKEALKDTLRAKEDDKSKGKTQDEPVLSCAELDDVAGMKAYGARHAVQHVLVGSGVTQISKSRNR